MTFHPYSTPYDRLASLLVYRHATQTTETNIASETLNIVKNSNW